MSTYDKFIKLRFSVSTSDAEIIDCRESIKELLAERDALAAQVAILKTAYGNLAGAINNLDDTDTDSEEIVDEMWGQVFSVMQDGWNSFSREPQQCLAEIKAEAVLSFATYIDSTGELSGDDCTFIIDEANQYADKIRNTGTWLKDSNVNGGKRQGGERWGINGTFG